MKSINVRRYEMLVRVRDFGDTYGHLLPQSSLAGETFATVADAVKQLGDCAVSKMSTDGPRKRSRTSARKALRERLEAMVRTAREIAQVTPEAADKFTLPEHPKDQELLTAGRLFMRNAEAFKAAFIAHALPETFLTELGQLVDTFEQALREHDSERSENTAAKANIEAAFTSGLAAVRKLDVMVKNTLAGNAVVMAVWERDRTVRRPSRPKPTATPVTEAAPTNPTPAPDNAVKAVA